LQKLREDMLKLMAQVYPGEDKVLVFGEGPRGARVMLIGEAPGQQEALLGRPFVGKAGKNLDGYIEATGLRREEMYVSNTVKFRPTRISAAGRTVNRTPSQEEISMFLPFLKREIELVSPGMIVTLGNVPLRALLGPGITIGEVHGRLLKLGTTDLFPMYHPASVIYNQSLKPVYAEGMGKLAQNLKN